MCLDIDEKFHTGRYPKAFIAQTDIVCFKVFKVIRRNQNYEEYQSPYRGMRYDFGKLYTVSFMRADRFKSVEAGLHSYRSESVARKKVKDWWTAVRVVPGIIPKGSRVFVGVGSELVSDKLIVYRTKKDLEAVHGPIQAPIAKSEGLKDVS